MALLAGAVGSGGSVAALDITAALLQTGREQLEQSQFEDRVSFHEGDIQHLPFEDGRFDLVWSSRAIHHLSDQLVGVREVKRVIKPGGRFAMREGGLRTWFLPGDLGIAEPGLETAWKWPSTNGSRRMFVKVVGGPLSPRVGPAADRRGIHQGLGQNMHAGIAAALLPPSGRVHAQSAKGLDR